MKIKELFNDTNFKSDSYYGYSKEMKILRRYLDKTDVIAYVKDNFGMSFLFKGINKYFSFIVISQDIGFVPMGKYIYRQNDLNFDKFSNMVYLNKDEYDNYKSSIFIGAL